MRVAASILFVAIAFACTFAGGSIAADRYVTINRFGLWTLRDLGYGDEVRFGTKRDLARPLIQFRLPQNASQGPLNWYIVRLHLRLTLKEDSGPGTLAFGAETNQMGCAAIDFTLKRTGNHPTIQWRSIGIVDGNKNGSSKHRIVELRYANYLQEQGVRPGLNSLDFSVGPRTGTVRIAEVRVFAEDSGIEYTRLGPANVVLNANIPTTGSPIRVGQRVTVDFAMRNTGERTARQINVSADYDDRVLSLLSSSSMKIAQLRPGGRAFGSFTFTAKRAGETPIFVTATTSSNLPGDDVTVKVLGKERLGPSQRKEAIALARSDTRLERILGGRESELNEIAPWTDESNGLIGADVTFRLRKRATIEGEWPAIDFKSGGDYSEAGMRRYRAIQVREITVLVDLRKHRVAAFYPLDGYVGMTAEQKEEALALARRDERLKRLLGGRETELHEISPWEEDDGSLIGAELTFRLREPATIDGEWLSIEFKPDGDYSKSRVERYRAVQVREIRVLVDSKKHRVVAYDPSDGEVVTSESEDSKDWAFVILAIAVGVIALVAVPLIIRIRAKRSWPAP